MVLSIASNPNAGIVRANLNKTQSGISQSFERLSSGLRINSAADDPAGLALADSLRADTRLASTAIRNANDGISIVSIADSALSEISGILVRMAELAEQSSNGAYSATQRSALAQEFVALGSEITRISKTTEFNDTKLLSGSSNTALQVGLDGSANSQIVINAVQSTLDSLGLAGSGSDALSYSIQSSTTADSQSAALNALDAVNAAISSLSTKRGTLGAAESRLSYAISNLSVARENFAAAESAIRDADIAQEVANLTRLQVLQQAGIAVLAQANQTPARALELLQ
jgi:flagellin